MSRHQCASRIELRSFSVNWTMYIQAHLPLCPGTERFLRVIDSGILFVRNLDVKKFVSGN